MSGLGAIFDRGLNQALERRFGIRDDIGFNLMPELAATCNIDTQQELQYPLGWKTWTASFGFNPLAANAMKLLFQNPPASNSIMLLEEITASTTIAADALCIGQPGVANVAGLTTPIVVHGIMDGRMQSSATGALLGGAARISTQQAAAALGIVGLNGRAYLLQNGVSFTVPGRPLVLIPGTNVLIAFQGLNSQQAISLTWRERMLNDQENAL